MSDFLSESQALRTCNLPSTSNWREWLRRTLPSRDISTGKLYEAGQVHGLAAKVRPLNGDIILPPEERAAPEPPRVAFSGPPALASDTARKARSDASPRIS